MALPVTSKLNQFLDAVVEALALYVKPNSGLNLVPNPVTVKRVMRLGDFTSLQKPLLAVQAGSWSVTPGCAHRFEGILRFTVHCLVSAGADRDEIELLDLVTDAVRAIQRDETLGGLVVYTFPVEFTPLVDVEAIRGYAQAAVTFESLYIWDAETP